MGTKGQEKKMFVSIDAGGKKKSRLGGQKKFLLPFLKDYCHIFNPSLTLKNNCF